MLHSVRCDLITFKNVTFHSGFNVIVAERSERSTNKQSRNGSGKSSLIEVIHFCLGASTIKKKVLMAETLQGYTFLIDIDLGGKRFTVSRKTKEPSYVVIDGDWSDWVIKPIVDKKTKEPRMSIPQWRLVLNWLMFGLSPEISEQKHSPSFRSLISYFVRRGRDAFSSPFTHFPKQPEWQKQVDHTFLIGLCWEHAQKWHDLKERMESLAQYKKAANSGLISGFSGSVGELEVTKVQLEEQVIREQEQLSNFRIHEQYRDIEARVNSLHERIRHFQNQNVSSRKMLEYYESVYQEEQPAGENAIAKMYEEAGILLPESVTRKIHEVQEFHQKITINRKSFLKSEIERLRNEVRQMEVEIIKLRQEYASLMSILQTHGALDEYSKLQQHNMLVVTKLEEVKTRIDNLKKFEQGTISLRIEQDRLRLDAYSDYQERSSVRERAVSLFNSNSEAIHEAPGSLIMNVEQHGFKFDVDIDKSQSQGVKQMGIFCYDLTLAQIWASKEHSPSMLIHDSTIFDGVDERQIAQALQLAARESQKLNFQYICCLNSDSIPSQEFDDDFDIQPYKVLELSDSGEDGGLFGIRF
jgi:uncharacterized protein YydD (DUF2326 family)